jgi:archaellum component FlaG (FlaF/FlaG flagellin family)
MIVMCEKKKEKKSSTFVLFIKELLLAGFHVKNRAKQLKHISLNSRKRKEMIVFYS